MYPQHKITDFTQAAKTLLGVKIDENYIFCSMTELQSATKAVTESYLRNEGLTKGKYGERSRVSPDTTAATEVQSSGNGATNTGAKLFDIIQNLLMHIVLSSQANHKVYEKLSKMGTEKTSTRLMAEAVSAVERYKTLKGRNKKPNNEEFIWSTSQTHEQRTQRKASEVPQIRRNQGDQTGKQIRDYKGGEELRCYNCSKKGHIRKRCPYCAFCKSPDHTTKMCQKRIAQAKGKYCSHCKISDSHNTTECLKLKALKKNNKGSVRAMQSADREENESSDYDSNEYDENLENY